MPERNDQWLMGALAAQDGYRGEGWLDEPLPQEPAGPTRITVRPADSMYPAREPPPDTLLPPPRNEPATAMGELFFPNLSRPETYGPRPPPTMTPNEAGKVPTGDPRVMSGLADLGSAAYNLIPGPGAGAATAAGIGKAVFMAAIPRTAAEHAVLARANRLVEAGAHPNQIWRMGGVYQTPGKKWATEVPDIGSSMLRGSAKDYKISPLSEHFSHPELYERAPWTANIPTQRMPPEMRNDPRFADLAGAYRQATPGQQPLLLYRPEGMMSEGQYLTPRRIILHETGHAIAQRHGLESGAVANTGFKSGSPEWRFYTDFLAQAEDAMKTGFMEPLSQAELTQRAREYAAWKAYNASAGEAASRAIETRMDWPLEKVAKISPQVTIEKDVPYAEQIVNYSKFIPKTSWSASSGKPFRMGALAAQDRYH